MWDPAAVSAFSYGLACRHWQDCVTRRAGIERSRSVDYLVSDDFGTSEAREACLA
jgi:hypothetical protein